MAYVNLIDLVYPVGAVYISYKSDNPVNLFGGSWTAITGRFPYFNSGTGTGGSNTHTLTTKEIPNHTHSIHCAYTSGSSRRDSDVIVYDGWDMSGYKWTTEWSGSVGGGASHNNMPAYQTLYAWRRTA